MKLEYAIMLEAVTYSKNDGDIKHNTKANLKESHRTHRGTLNIKINNVVIDYDPMNTLRNHKSILID